jgi:uncharacterized protein (TIGR02217 family)
MAFHDVRFPTNLSFGSVGGPERRTEVVTLSNGFEERNTPWEHSRRRYDAGAGLRSTDDVSILIAFFEARRGKLHAFRWKDWSDHKSCLPSRTISTDDQEIGRGDGIETVFQLIKTYSSGSYSYARPIRKPVEGSVRIAIANDPKVETVEYTVDHSTGVITFETPPDIGAQITAGYEFDVPVRFDTDSLLTTFGTYQAGDVPDVPVAEVRF